MRFYFDTKAYYFSTNEETDQEERSLIFSQSKEYIKEYLKGGFSPEDTVGGTIKKFAPIVLFLCVVVLLIVFSVNKIVPGILFTFGGPFIVFGILMLLPSKKVEHVELPHTAKIPKGVGAAMSISVGLGVVIPAVLAPKYGYSKAFMAGGASWFVLAGLFFIVYTLIGMARFKRAFKNSVQGRCIGYIKMIEGNGSDSSYHRMYITGAPVFEYSINGSTYKAFQEDNMRTGRLSPYVGDIVELGVLPEDPYAVFYHENKNARIFAFVMSFIALAAGIFLFCMLPAVNDNGGFAVNTRGGQVLLAKAKFDDKTIESYLKTSDFTIEYATVKAIYEESGITVMEFSNGVKQRLSDDDKKKYHEGLGVYLIRPADGGAGLNFIADEWEYTGTRQVTGLSGQ